MIPRSSSVFYLKHIRTSLRLWRQQDPSPMYGLVLISMVPSLAIHLHARAPLQTAAHAAVASS